MTEAAQIEAQVELATKDMKRSHGIAVRSIAALKMKINDLEQSLSLGSFAPTKADMKKLDALTARLDRLVDSVISESARAKRKLERLKQECRTQAIDSVKVENLETAYKETEQLAKDLLCYSLGHFRSSSYGAR